jgi:hypothetical protein
MLATLWLPALIKALATALVVVFASAIAEAFGPFWGALIASLPVSAGPVYVFLAMQHGADFVAASALSSCAANAATGLFLIVYAGLTQRLSPWRCLAVAVSAWLVGSLATQQIDWTPATALVLNLVVYGCGFIVPSPARVAGVAPVVRVRRRWFDLPVRAVAVAGFVSLVVAVSSLLGPRATGIAAVFPVSLISLIVIVRPRIGGAAASLLAANALRSMLGFGVMLLALHLAIRPWGIAVAFGIALLASALWSGGLLALRSQWMMGWPGSRPEPVLGRPLGPTRGPG